MDLGTLIVGVVVFAGIVALLFLVISRGTRAMFGPRRRLEAELGRDALKARLARGDITKAEFDEADRSLRG